MAKGDYQVGHFIEKLWHSFGFNLVPYHSPVVLQKLNHCSLSMVSCPSNYLDALGTKHAQRESNHTLTPAFASI